MLLCTVDAMQGYEPESLPTTTDELTLSACFITLRSDLAADNDQLGGNHIFKILMPCNLVPFCSKGGREENV